MTQYEFQQFIFRMQSLINQEAGVSDDLKRALRLNFQMLQDGTTVLSLARIDRVNITVIEANELSRIINQYDYFLTWKSQSWLFNNKVAAFLHYEYVAPERTKTLADYTTLDNPYKQNIQGRGIPELNDVYSDKPTGKGMKPKK